MNALQELEERALEIAEKIIESEEIPDDIFSDEFDTRLFNVETIAQWLVKEGHVEYGEEVPEDEIDLLARQWVKYYRRISRW